MMATRATITTPLATSSLRRLNRPVILLRIRIEHLPGRCRATPAPLATHGLGPWCSETAVASACPLAFSAPRTCAVASAWSFPKDNDQRVSPRSPRPRTSPTLTLAAITCGSWWSTSVLQSRCHINGPRYLHDFRGVRRPLPVKLRRLPTLGADQQVLPPYARHPSPPRIHQPTRHARMAEAGGLPGDRRTRGKRFSRNTALAPSNAGARTIATEAGLATSRGRQSCEFHLLGASPA